MTDLSPILVAPLFREVSGNLVKLLQSLDTEEWHRPTSSSLRNVKDIATHLLDGSLRRLSIQRDGYMSPDGFSQPQPDESLLDFLNRLNSEWETGTRRLSPQVIVSLIEWADAQLADLFESLDPFDTAIFPVAWAGENESLNWMDVARDYTEKWYHTQQIFEATGHSSTIIDKRLFHPCLDIFMRALPFTFRAINKPDATLLTVEITGNAGGQWFLLRQEGAWGQVSEKTGTPTARFTITQDSAWKLFTKRLDQKTALTRFPDIQIEGDTELGSHVLDMVSVMA